MSKVKETDLGHANISRKEWEHIKLLLGIDAEIFKPNEFGVFSPHSLLVDMTKYKDPLPLEAKEILYRPPKLKILYEKYWQLAKAVEGREKQENDRKTLKEYHPRFPQKTTQELQAIEKIFNKLDLVIAEDERELKSKIKEGKEDQDISKDMAEYKFNLALGFIGYQGGYTVDMINRFYQQSKTHRLKN